MNNTHGYKNEHDLKALGMSIEDVPEFAIKQRESAFAPEATQLFTAVRAVWALWRRGRLGLMRDIFDLDIAPVEKCFLAFDEKYDTTGRIRLIHDEQVELLLASLPNEVWTELVPVCLAMNEIYKKIHKGEYDAYVSSQQESDTTEKKSRRRTA